MVETVFPGDSEPLTAPDTGPRDPDIYIPTDPPVDVPVDPPVYVPSDVPMDPPADFPSPDDDVEFPLERSPNDPSTELRAPQSHDRLGTIVVED